MTARIIMSLKEKETNNEGISGMVVVVIGIVALWTAPSTKSDMSPTAYKQKKIQRTFHIAAGASCIAGGW